MADRRLPHFPRPGDLQDETVRFLFTEPLGTVWPAITEAMDLPFRSSVLRPGRQALPLGVAVENESGYFTSTLTPFSCPATSSRSRPPMSRARSPIEPAPASLAPPKRQRAADQGICRTNFEPSLLTASKVKSSPFRVPVNVPPSSPLPAKRARRPSWLTASIILIPSSSAGFFASHWKVIVPSLAANHCHGKEMASVDGS